jgi:hypothetical protein
MTLSSRALGIILVVAGLLIYFANVGIFAGEFVLIGIGAAFIAVYFMARRHTGFLVAGCVITAVGLFAAVDRWFPGRDHGYLFFLMLALAFAAVYLVESFVRREAVWALYVSLGLGVFSAFIMIVENDPPLFRGVASFWPILLVGLGIWLLVDSQRKNGGDA